MLIALVAGAGFSQNSDFSHVWIDDVKHGPMIRELRGLGVIADHTTVQLTIPESQIADVRRGQMVDVDSRDGILRGKVMRVDPVVLNDKRRVTVRLRKATSVPVGTNVDGTIELERLSDVVYLGRPVFGSPNSTGTLFKIDADCVHATKVRVRFGRASVNTIEILEG